MDLGEVLTWTTNLTMQAAAHARELQQRDMTIDRKADGSVVTNIDRTLEQMLRDAIKGRFPDHAILGEEFGFEAAPDPYAPLWAIDPVDGTTNLANGLPLWCVSVGLVVGDNPAVGVVVLPELNQTFAAAAGLGATRNGVRLAPLGLGGALGQEMPYAISSTCARTVDFSRMVAKLRIYGSAAIDLCWTATGQFHGAQSIKTSLYDIAAGLCIAHEVGAETRWLADGALWSAREMATAGARRKVLMTAPPRTLVYLREHLSEPT